MYCRHISFSAMPWATAMANSRQVAYPHVVGKLEQQPDRQGWVKRGSYSVTLSNGDQLGALATSAGQVKVYRNGALLTTVDVSAWPYYADGGYIGVWIVNASAARLDDFGGGTSALSLTPAQPGTNWLAEWWDGLWSSPRLSAFSAGVTAWWAQLWRSGWYASVASAQAEARLQPAMLPEIQTPTGEVWRSYYYAGSARVAVRVVGEAECSKGKGGDRRGEEHQAKQAWPMEEERDEKKRAEIAVADPAGFQSLPEEVERKRQIASKRRRQARDISTQQEGKAQV